MLSLMDVMKPEIINIEGRRYRKTPVRTQNVEEEQQHGTYYEDDLYYDDEPESCDMEYDNIEKVAGGGYRECMKDIPSFYFRFIDGSNHEKRKDLERKTKTSIQLPKGSSGSGGNIVITGKDRSGIIAARTKINTIIEMNRCEQPAAHFLSVKLACEEVSKNFAEFKKDVLSLKARGVDASLFQQPERLHLTLCLLTFLNDAELENSAHDLNSIINDLREKHLEGDGILKLALQGIEYMNDDPGEVDVLYAKVNVVDMSNKFQSFVDDLVSALVSSGYSKKQYDRVKLHATIINTLFRDDSSRDHGGRKTRVTFDAKPILENYSDFFFGVIDLRSLDVSLRKTFDKNGHYKVALSLSLCQ